MTSISAVDPRTLSTLIENHDFNSIAQLILNQSALVVSGAKAEKKSNSQKYSICEIEMYCHDSKHPDPYVHCHKEQGNYGRWYFHRASKNDDSKYRGGTYKGLDIALGSSTRFFGILIRSIMKENTIIEGPCCSVNEILKSADVKSIDELTGNKPLPVNDPKLTLTLYSSPISNYNISKGVRVGLKAKNETSYLNAKYRFTTMPNKLKKGSKFD